MTRSIAVLTTVLLAGCAASPAVPERHALAVAAAAEDQLATNTDLGGQNTFNGTNTFSGGTTVSGGLTISGPVNFTGAVTLPGSSGSPAPSAPTQQVFLKIDGIDGESTDSRHHGEIDVSSFSWGASQPTAAQSAGGGAGAGKVTFNPFSITKHVDKSSPKLMQACATGKHFPTATIKVYRTGESSTQTQEWTLSDVIVVDIGTEPGGTEHIGLRFAKVLWKTFTPRPDGGIGDVTSAGFDLKTNRAALRVLDVAVR